MSEERRKKDGAKRKASSLNSQEYPDASDRRKETSHWLAAARVEGAKLFDSG